MKQYLLFVFIIISAVKVTAQSSFKQSYDVTGDNFSKAYQTNTLDGGLILITRSTHFSGQKYFTIFKTLADGNLQWSQRFAQPGNCNVSNIVQLPDSTYFFSFVELNFPEKYYIVHLDINGALIYCRSFTPPPNYIVAFDPVCIARSDGHVYIQADLHDLSNGMFGWHLFEVDDNGNIVFSTCYNGSILKCLGRNFAQCANGDLVLVGYQRDSVSLEFGPVITRVDSDGVLLWSKLYLDTSTSIAGLSIHELTNGNLVVTASHTTPGNEVIRLETDLTGNLLRAREYGNAVSSFSPYASLQSVNNSLIIYGTCDSGSFAMKLDSTGEILAAQKFYWVVPGKILAHGVNQFSFSGVDSQTNHAIIFTSDSSLNSCFGISISVDTGSIQFQTIPISNAYPVTLVDSAFQLNDTLWPGMNSKVCGPVGTESIITESAFSFFPNPASDVVSFISSEQVKYVELIDYKGSVVCSEPVRAACGVIHIGRFAPGLYVLRAEFENHVEYRRLVIE